MLVVLGVFEVLVYIVLVVGVYVWKSAPKPPPGFITIPAKPYSLKTKSTPKKPPKPAEPPK